MDVIASPLVTVVLNLVASVLVARGILDSHSTVAFVQTGNNLIAGIVTVWIGVYSIYKMVELKKHQLTLANQAPTATKTESIVTISQPISQTTSTNPTGQMGTPGSTISNPDPAKSAA